MHKIAESDFVSYMYLYLITDICLGYLRVGELRVCVWGGGGGESVMRGNKTKAVLAASVYIPLTD